MKMICSLHSINLLESYDLWKTDLNTVLTGKHMRCIAHSQVQIKGPSLALCFSLSQVPIFIPAVFSFTCFFMVFLSLYSDPTNTGIGFAISLTGIPAYYIFIHFERKPKWFQKLSGQRLHKCKWQQHKTSEYAFLSSHTFMILIMMADWTWNE